MAHFEITGGAKLHGRTYCSGSKNAALPIMAAALMASQPVRLLNVPHLTDIRTQSELLEALGMQVTFGVRCLTIAAIDDRPVQAPEVFLRRMRAGFCMLGPLLARRGRAIVPLPGGCNIGHRPVDLHLRGLAALGADLRLEHGCVIAEAKQLHGAEIDLLGPCGTTVTGTANVLSAAVLARGTTIIYNAALEPEVVDLGRFLIALGARIEGLGTSTIRIFGVDQLGGTTHRLIPDRIEAATLLLAGAITRSALAIGGVEPQHLDQVLQVFDKAGIEIQAADDRVSISAARALRPVDITTRPYPGFPTDLQAQWTALMTIAHGTSVVRDSVFPHRFLHVAELNRLGSKIVCTAGTATITGVTQLSGASVVAGDLRASATLVLAALAAKGCTIVNHIEHLDRGYERLDDKLRQLGAQIVRVADHPEYSVMPNAAAALFNPVSRLASGRPTRKANSK